MIIYQPTWSCIAYILCWLLRYYPTCATWSNIQGPISDRCLSLENTNGNILQYIVKCGDNGRTLVEDRFMLRIMIIVNAWLGCKLLSRICCSPWFYNLLDGCQIVALISIWCAVFLVFGCAVIWIFIDCHWKPKIRKGVLQNHLSDTLLLCNS